MAIVVGPQSDGVTTELKHVREREIELKRLNGELSCRECRRTKSGCDKKVPCTTCIDRDCPDICPLGTIQDPNYEKPVSVKAAEPENSKPDKRLDKLQAMHNRITALEDALQLQTEGVHPLLANALVRIKRYDVVQESERCSTTKDLDLLIKSFGTLSMGNHAVYYIGPSSVEVAIREKRHASRALQEGLDFFESSLPDDLIQASSLFPFMPACFAKPSTYAKLLSHLPSYARATGLIEAYFTNLSWYASCIEREQVRDDLLPTFYPGCRPLDPSVFHEEQSHELGLLFVLLAAGAVADLTQHFFNKEAEDLEKLARYALGLRSILEHGSLAACQAMVLLGSYESLTDRKKSEHSSSSLIVCGLKIGLSIGLHLDPGRWNLEPRIAERRRWVFWQLNTLDKMRSSEKCYPPIFKSGTIDCKWPEDGLALQDKYGRVVESIWRWRHRFTRESLTPLSELMSEARPIHYTRILELGAWLQAQEPHPFAKMTFSEQYAACGDASYGNDEFHRHFHPIISVWWKQLSIQRLHRSYFARAVIENPTNPYESIFAPSFLATFHSTRIMLKLAIRSYESSNLVLRRLHNVWGNVVVCGIIVGTIACHVKVQACRDEAHELLEQLVTLFEHASEHTVPAENLSILKDLLKRSKETYEADSVPKPQSVQLNRKIPSIAQVYRDADDGLLMLSGHDARVIVHEHFPEGVSIPSLDYGSHLLPTQSLLARSSMSSAPSQSSASAQGDSPPGVANTSRDKSPSDAEKDTLSWLTDHEKDEACISMLSAIAQNRCDARREFLKAAGINASPVPFLHGPTYIDLESKTLFGGEGELDDGDILTSGLEPDFQVVLDLGPQVEDANGVQQPGEPTADIDSLTNCTFNPFELQETNDLFNRLTREISIEAIGVGNSG